MTFSSAGFARDVIIVLGGTCATVLGLLALFALACLLGRFLARCSAAQTSPVDADAEQAAALGEQR